VGIERLLAWKAAGRWWQALAAGLALGMAPYARPHLALFLGLGAFLLLDSGRISGVLDQVRKSPWRWTPIGIAALTLATVALLTYHGGAVLQAPGSQPETGSLGDNAFAYFLYLAVPMPLAIPWVLAHWRRSPGLLLAGGVAFALGARLLLGPTDPDTWALAAAFAGAISLGHLLWDALGSRDHARILAVLWILIPLPVVVYAHLPIKFLLPVAPAIVLVLLRLSSGLSRRTAVVCGALLVVAGTAYSCLILEADARFANVARRAAKELIEPHLAAGERVWGAGEWGFYWYALRAGAQVTRPDAPGPYPGDLLAIPTGGAGSPATLDRLPNRTLVQTFAYSCNCGRTMGSGAGLYSNRLGNLLWAWGSGEVAGFQLWRVH
jgi:hypothetical protein